MADSTTINERFELIINALNLSKSSFAKSLGTSTGRLSNIIQGRNKPDSQILAKVAEVYPQINLSWLLTGEGLRLTNVSFLSSSGEAANSENSIPHTQVPHRSDTQVEAPPKVFISHSQQDKAHIEAVAAQFDVEPIQRMFEASGDTYGRVVWSVENVLDFQLRQQAIGIQRQLERVLSRLLNVQELVAELLGIRFDDERFESLKQRIFRRRQFSGDEPLDKMSQTNKMAHIEAREQLLEECEDELTHYLDVLHEGVISGRVGKGKPRKGSAGALLKDLLQQRQKQGGRWGSMLEEAEEENQ